MPFSGDANTNTQLLIKVQATDQDTQITQTWPATTPATHGVLSSDSQGNLAWVPQLVSGLLGDLDNAYFASGVIDSTGSATLTPQPLMQYKSYTAAAVICFVVRTCAFLDAAVQGNTDVKVTEVKTGIMFDPNATSLARVWTALPACYFGEISAYMSSLQVNPVRIRGSGCAPTFTVTGQTGTRVNLEISAYQPYNVPLAPIAATS